MREVGGYGSLGEKVMKQFYEDQRQNSGGGI